MCPDASAGSIADIVYSGISPFPGAISGVLISVINQQRFFAEQFTGDAIGTIIAERYQPGITSLATAHVLRLMAVQDLGTSNVSIGDLTTTNANLSEMARQFEERGIFQLKSLAKGMKVGKSRG